MKYELNGFSTPFGGISWNKNETGKELFSYLFLYLESKRILVNPSAMEIKEWCIDSVLEIKNALVSISRGVSLKQFDKNVLQTMVDSCNDYLNAVTPLNLFSIIYKCGNRWEDLNFDNAMKTFRNKFKTEITKVENKYNLSFAKEIPEMF